MAFFAESTVQESYQDLDIVVNDYTDFDMLATEACTTIQEMDNAIMFGIGRYELNTIREGAEVVYTEGMLDTIKSKIEKIWNFIKNWVKNVWNKFIAWSESYVRGDKAFLSKYKKKIEENVIHLDKDFEMTLKYGKYIDDKGNDAETITDNAGTIAIGYGNKINAVSGNLDERSDAFQKLLEEYDDKIEEFKDGLKDTDLELDINASWVRTNIKKVMDVVAEDVSKIKRAATKSEKVVNDIAKNNIKAYETAAKATKDADTKNNINQKVSALKTFASKTSSFLTAQTNICIKAIKGAKSDARAVCRKVLTAKPNPKYNESAFDHNDFEAYFNI